MRTPARMPPAWRPRISSHRLHRRHSRSLQKSTVMKPRVSVGAKSPEPLTLTLFLVPLQETPAPAPLAAVPVPRQEPSWAPLHLLGLACTQSRASLLVEGT